MDLNLWLEPSLLEKTRQKASEARAAEQPFVPRTIASSTVNPYQNPTSPFSTSSYTSTSRLSNPPPLVPKAGDNFSRTNHSITENQAQQGGGIGFSSTTTTITTTGGGYSSPLSDLSPEQPNRLASTSTPTILDWYTIWDYVPASFLTDDLPSWANLPLYFFEGTDPSTNLIQEGPVFPIIGGTDRPYSTNTRLSYTGNPALTNEGPFGTTVLRSSGISNSIRFINYFARAQAREYNFVDTTVKAVEGSGSEAYYPIEGDYFTGTFEIDVYAVVDSFEDLLYQRWDVFFVMSAPDTDPIPSFPAISIGVLARNVEEVLGGLIYDVGSERTSYNEIAPTKDNTWTRISLTFDEGIIYIHVDGNLWFTIPNYTIEELNQRGAKLEDSAVLGWGVLGGSDLGSVYLGAAHFTTEVLYGPESYEVGPIIPD